MLILATTILAAPVTASPPRVQVMSITDQGASVAGRTTITTYDGASLPPSGPAQSVVIDQMPGWPKLVGGDGNFAPLRGLVLADLDGDRNADIIASSTDGFIYAWKHTGESLPGFPVRTIALPQYAPSVADLDGDGDLEIVQTTRGLTSGGRLYAIDHLGQNLPGFPRNLNNNNVESCPTLYDLDGDGVMEIIVGERAWPIGYVHVIRLDGSEWGGNWPVALDHVPAATASVGDIDSDGSPEVVYLSYNSLYVINVDGTVEAGFPRQFANTNFSYQSAALADLDGDDDREIIVGAHKDAAGCYVLHHTGASYPGWPRLLGTWSYCPPTVTDLTGDGTLEILDGRAGIAFQYSPCFWAWTSGGQTLPGFPYGSNDGGGSEGPLTVADIDGDGVKEIFGDNNIAVSGQGFLFGVDAQGQALPGFPIRTQGFSYMNSAMIADVDNDGDYELGVISTYERTSVYVNLYDLPYEYSVSRGDWPTYHARDSRGGWYGALGGCTREPQWVCDGDVDGNGAVNPVDAGLVQAAFCGAGECSETDLCQYDLDCNGAINPVDAGIVQSLFGACDPPRDVCP
jgi:hypothetical protein